LVTSVRGIALEPITAASVALGFIGFMNAAFGLRPLPFFALLPFFFAIDYLPLSALNERDWLVGTTDREFGE
jgi:hypothetical protein